MECNIIKIKNKLYYIDKPLIMGILNFTPDSFYSNSQTQKEDVYCKITQMLYDGADIIDIGAISTNPNSKKISENEEWMRIEPILKLILKHFPNKVFSIDTFRAKIAKRAVLDYGIDIINDISGGEFDSEMFKTVAECSCPYVLMHLKGNFETMHYSTDYKSIVEDMIYYFSKKINELHLLGVSDIIVDPGFGFSKTIDDNFLIMSKLSQFKIFELPILIGISRKSMIWKTIKTTPEMALNGTSALNMFSLINGANILRVHDVLEAKQCVDLFLNF